MKILYVVSTLGRTGPIVVLRNLVKFLDRDKYTPIVLTLSPEPNDSLREEFLIMGVEVRTLGLSRISGLAFGIRALRNHVLEISPDIIHTMGFRADLYPLFFKQTPPVLTTLHNIPHEDYILAYGRLLGTIMHKLSMLAYRKHSFLVACSHSVRDASLKNDGIDTAVIHNGVDTTCFSRPTIVQKNIAKQQLGILDNRPVFIYVGRMTKRKDPVTVIKAFLRAFGKHEAHLVMVGSGEETDQCKDLTSDRSDVTFVGHVINPQLYLRMADFYVSSSRAEGFPNAVLEALATGLPVVLSGINPHKEIIALNPSIGEEFLPGDHIGLSLLMKKVVSSAVHNEFTSAARIAVETTLSAKEMSRQYEKVYEHLNTQQRAGRTNGILSFNVSLSRR